MLLLFVGLVIVALDSYFFVHSRDGAVDVAAKEASQIEQRGGSIDAARYDARIAEVEERMRFVHAFAVLAGAFLVLSSLYLHRGPREVALCAILVTSVSMLAATFVYADPGKVLGFRAPLIGLLVPAAIRVRRA